MRVRYDRETDTLTVTFKDSAAVIDSDDDRPGTILDDDETGDLVSLEILDASRRVTDTSQVDYQTTAPED